MARAKTAAVPAMAAKALSSASADLGRVEAALVAARGRVVPDASAELAAEPLTRAAEGRIVVVAATSVVKVTDDCDAGAAATTTIPAVGARDAEDDDAEGEQPQMVRVTVTTTGPRPDAPEGAGRPMGRIVALPVTFAGWELPESGAAMTVTPPVALLTVVVAGGAVTVLRVPVDAGCELLVDVGARPMMASVPSVMVVTGASEDEDCAAAKPMKAAANKLENCMLVDMLCDTEIGAKVSNGRCDGKRE